MLLSSSQSSACSVFAVPSFADVSPEPPATAVNDLTVPPSQTLAAATLEVPAAPVPEAPALAAPSLLPKALAEAANALPLDLLARGSYSIDNSLI